MNLEELSNIGEMIGALATVITLAYLAVQIRRNTAEVKATSRRAVGDGMRQSSKFNA